MKLTKDLNIKIYEVLTDYRVKVTNSPFIAILKFAVENEDKISSNQLYSDLLQPLSEKACENILERLSSIGYFEKEDDLNILPENENDFINQKIKIVYKLTNHGYTSAQQEEFYENRNGILKIFITNSEFIEQKVVKIEEINRQDSFEDKYIKNISQTDLQEIQNSKQHIDLENGTFILDNFKEKSRVFEDDSKQLVLTANNDSLLASLLNFIVEFPSSLIDVRSVILRNEFGNNYMCKEGIINVDFNPRRLELSRDVSIPKPQINNTIFNSIVLPDVKYSPKNSVEARNWFKALITQKIGKYFLSETDFNEFTNEIAQEFELFSKELKNSVSRENVIQELDEEKDFYKKAKLETIDYLNY